MWKLYLAESESLEYISDITSLARGKTLEVALNKPGSLSFSMHLGNPWASDIVAVKNCVVAEKNGTPVWSGPIWNKNEDFVSESLGVSCVGWFEILNKRYLWEEKTYLDKTDGFIAFKLLEYANEWEIEGDVHPTWINEGTNSSTSLRDIEYAIGTNIGSEIQNLTNIESGYDWTIDPVTRDLDIHAWDDFSDLTHIVWGYNWGPNNLASFNRETSADSMGNQYFIEGKTLIGEAHDDESIDYHGQVFQRTESLTELDVLNMLGAYANAELEANKNPRVIYSMKPKVDAYSIFEDYQIGDKTYVTAKSAGAEVNNDAVRIFGANINIDEEGNERIENLQLTYQGQ